MAAKRRFMTCEKLVRTEDFLKEGTLAHACCINRADGRRRDRDAERRALHRVPAGLRPRRGLPARVRERRARRRRRGRRSRDATSRSSSEQAYQDAVRDAMSDDHAAPRSAPSRSPTPSRGDGEMLVSPIGLAAADRRAAGQGSPLAPDLLMTDGVAPLVANVLPVSGDDRPAPVVEGWLPYRKVFELLWWGRRHVMMGATQIDRFGNQNIACIGAAREAEGELLGMRGAPGNTIIHPTSYWVPNHSDQDLRAEGRRGVGPRLRPRRGARAETPRASTTSAAWSRTSACFDFATPDHRMRLRVAAPGRDARRGDRERPASSSRSPPTSRATRAPTAEELRCCAR